MTKLVLLITSLIKWQKQKVRLLFLAALAILCMGLFPYSVEAHRATVYAWVDGHTVHVIGKFSGGRKAQNAPVEVYDSKGNLLFTGHTDSEGTIVFSTPQKSDMKIVLQAGMGHRAEWTVRAEEFDETVATKPSSASDKRISVRQPQAEETSGSTTAAIQTSDSTARYLTADQIQILVESTLDRKLKPILEHLSESRQSGPSVTDIIGGIGYILGLVGLGAYIQFRRNNSRRR